MYTGYGRGEIGWPRFEEVTDNSHRVFDKFIYGVCKH